MILIELVSALSGIFGFEFIKQAQFLQFLKIEEELLTLAQFLNEELCPANEIILTFQEKISHSLFNKENYYV